MPRTIGVLVLLAAAAAGAQDKNASADRGCEEVAKTGRFQVFFEAVEIASLAQTIADATCRTVIVPDGLRGKLSIIGPERSARKLSAAQFYRAFLSALDAQGLTVVENGAFLRIVEKAKARQGGTPLADADGQVRSLDEEMVTRVFRVDPDELEALRMLIGNFVSPGGDALSFPPEALIVTDVASNLRRLERLLQQLEQPDPLDTLKVFELAHADAADVVNKLQLLLAKAGTAPAPRPRGSGAAPTAGMETVVADERTNRLLVFGTPERLAQISALVAELDVETAAGGRAVLINLENGDAKEIAQNLQTLVSTGTGGKSSGAGVFSSEVKVTANASTNALLVVASARDLRTVRDLVRALDAPRRQVFIETVIMEVDLDRGHELAVGMHGAIPTGEGPIVLGSAPEGAPSSLSLLDLVKASGLIGAASGGASLNVAGQAVRQFGVSLRALAQDSGVNILSTPHILTADNEEAEIAVGRKVVFVTTPPRNLPVPTTANPQAADYASMFLNQAPQVSRENVELRLAVKPHIGAAGAVHLEITHEAEEVLAGQRSAFGPDTATRSAKTAVITQDGQTVVLGGIVQERETEEVSKLPVLGDIPLLGHLFRSTRTRKQRTNLLVVLTPHILDHPSEFQRVLDDKVRERERLLMEIYGRVPGTPLPMGISERPGPLMSIGQVLAREQSRPENGGDGAAGERVFSPPDTRQTSAIAAPR